jgi:hypothetical protein
MNVKELKTGLSYRYIESDSRNVWADIFVERIDDDKVFVRILEVSENASVRWKDYTKSHSICHWTYISSVALSQDRYILITPKKVEIENIYDSLEEMLYEV